MSVKFSLTLVLSCTGNSVYNRKLPPPMVGSTPNLIVCPKGEYNNQMFCCFLEISEIVFPLFWWFLFSSLSCLLFYFLFLYKDKNSLKQKVSFACIHTFF